MTLLEGGTAGLGELTLWLALVLALYGAGAAGAAALPRWRVLRGALLESARNASRGVAALTVLGCALLLAALVGHDFSLRYVAQHSARDAPLAVTLTGLWAGQAGSLLYWATGLAALVVLLEWRESRRVPALMPVTLATLLAVLGAFLLLLVTVSNPFEALPEPVRRGRGLNPLLWDDGMRIHPPLLLAGYMSFAAPYALALAVLAAGDGGAAPAPVRREWLGAVRRWMLAAWAIQGAGLLAGAWWAYRVLGWGGYWGWDPVENVALLPWLTATAFLHSAMVQERRGMLKGWTMGLAVASFGLAVFGTFVVRSGIISSVHSFAVSDAGPAFLAILGLVVAGPLVLLLFRLPALQPEGTLDGLLSREAGLLLNNLLLTATAAAVFWGTVFPLLTEALQGATVSVGAPFYQATTGPLLLGVLVLMGAGPLLAWRRTPLPLLWRRLRWPLAVAGAVGLLLGAAGVRQGLALLALCATAFTGASVALELGRGARRRRLGGEALPPRTALTLAGGRRRYGGHVVHLGMVLIAAGVIASHSFQQEAVFSLAAGETATVGRYTLTQTGLTARDEPGVRIVAAGVTLDAGARRLGTLWAERRTHRDWEQQPVTGVAVRTTWPWLEDVYVLLSGWEEDGTARLRVFVNPLVCLLWIGGGLGLAGTLLAAWPAPVAAARRPAPARGVPVRRGAPAPAGAVALLLAALAALGALTALGALGAATPVAHGATTGAPARGPNGAVEGQRMEAQRIARELRCPVCQGLSVADSPTALAEEMRALIGKKLAAGESRDEIVAYFVERYGEGVLLVPPRAGLGGVLWWGPLAIFAAGGAVTAATLRRWRRAGARQSRHTRKAPASHLARGAAR